jgi:predicted dehydrogenase
MVGVAVIGLGVYGEIHARTYATAADVTLVGVCDTRVERSQSLAGQLGCKAFTDHTTLLRDPAVEAVSIALPDHLHHDVALAALKAGKHALVEKPLATEESQCLEMISAAQENGVHLMTDFAQRWSPYVQQAKAAVAANQLGEVQLVYYRASDTIFVPTTMLSWAGQSSAAWFLGSHCLDNLLWIFGARSAYAGGSGDTLTRLNTIRRDRVLAGRGYTTADFYLTTIEWASGMVTQLENCWILPECGPSVADLKMQFIGSAGSLLVDGTHNRMVELQTDKATYPDTTAAIEVFGVPSGFAAESIRHFAAAIAAGTAPRVDGVDGLAVTRLIQAMEQSAAAQAPIDIDWNPYAFNDG